MGHGICLLSKSKLFLSSWVQHFVSLVVNGTHERKWYSAWNLSVVSIYSVTDIAECRPDRVCRLQSTGTTFCLNMWVDDLLNTVLSMLCTLGKLTLIWSQLLCFFFFIVPSTHQTSIVKWLYVHLVCCDSGVRITQIVAIQCWGVLSTLIAYMRCASQPLL